MAVKESLCIVIIQSDSSSYNKEKAGLSMSGRVVKSQNSSKSHLFQKLKNTTISR